MSKSDHKDDPVRSAYYRLQLVTPQLFAQFLAEKGVNKGCLACGLDKLSTPETMSLDSSRSPFKDLRDDWVYMFC